MLKDELKAKAVLGTGGSSENQAQKCCRRDAGIPVFPHIPALCSLERHQKVDLQAKGRAQH